MITFAQVLVAIASIPMMLSGCFEILEARSQTRGMKWQQLAWGLFLMVLDTGLLGWATRL